MKRSTISPDGKSGIRKIASSLAVALFWLAVWQIAYLLVNKEVLLVSPITATTRLFSLSAEPLFWKSVLSTCLRVVVGFGGALVTGTLLAALCARFRVLQRLTSPLMGIVRATPVASFIILALVWMKNDHIPGFIAYLVATPIVWANLMAGLASVDGSLLEMARVFGLSSGKVLRYIYLPAEAPHFASACSSGLGLAWKSAVAAEVIARPGLAVGKQINDAKIYLNMADLFAWTMAVILLSLLVEKVAIRLLRRLTGRLSGPGTAKGGEAGAAEL